MNLRTGALWAACLAVLFSLAFFVGASLPAAQAPQPSAQSQQAQPGLPSAQPVSPQPPAAQPVTAYTLPPELYRKARNLGRIRFRYAIISFFYGLVVLWIVLRCRLAPRFRDWAERCSPRRVLQVLIFSPLLILTIDILEIPTGIYDNWLSRKYGISVQGWASWTWDWAKGEAISVIVGTILIAILYAVIRRSPRRWWFYFWLASLPLLVFAIFLQPLIVDPLFHKFEPLAEKDPSLAAALEQMARRAGENIPQDRMFWMRASEKSNAVDAYVTGIGSSKRIVVWDTAIAKMTTPEIVFAAGHEMGHYVLHHIVKLILFYAAAIFVFLALGYLCVGRMLARWGSHWAIRGLDDWASLPALLLLLSIFSFAADPATNAFSRYVEHQADQYGLEVTHGLTPDSGQVAAQAFEVLGVNNLADPRPNPVDVIWFYDHPPVSSRIRFCLSYDPWAKGGHGEFVP